MGSIVRSDCTSDVRKRECRSVVAKPRRWAERH